MGSLYFHGPYKYERKEFVPKDKLFFVPVHDLKTERYKSEIAGGAKMPPVEVEEIHGNYVLRNGHHRATALAALGRAIPAVVAISLRPCIWKGKR
jgi:hypothetical protein